MLPFTFMPSIAGSLTPALEAAAQDPQPNKPVPTVGALDMGGASTQITFAPSTGESSPNRASRGLCIASAPPLRVVAKLLVKVAVCSGLAHPHTANLTVIFPLTLPSGAALRMV